MALGADDEQPARLTDLFGLDRQREIIYSQRAKVLDGEDLSSAVRTMVKETIDGTVDRYLVDKEVHDHWNLTGLRDYFLGWLTVEQDLRFTTALHWCGAGW